MIRILLVADSESLIRRVDELVIGCSVELKMSGCARSRDEALALLARGEGDVVLVQPGHPVLRDRECSLYAGPQAPVPFVLVDEVEEEYRGDADHSLRIHVIHLNVPGSGGFVRSIRQACAHHDTLLTMQRRLVFQRLAASISRWFLSSDDSDFAIHHCLLEIALASGAGRAYLFLLRDEGALMDNTHEWCAAGVSPQKRNLQGLETKTFPWWLAQLRNNNPIHIENVEQLPPEAGAEKDILQSQGIRSLLVLPLWIGGEVGGFVGFDNVTRTGKWSTEDIELLQMTAGLVGSALHRQQARNELDVAREEALQAARSKAEFVDYVAHEIRTPLTTIIATVDALAEDQSEHNEQNAYIELLSQGVKALTAVVNQTLEFSRAEAGRITLESIPFCLASCLSSRLEMHRASADARSLALTFSCDPQIPETLYGDSNRIAQVLGNLLGNAIKFTAQGGVHVAAEVVDDGPQTITVRILVRDSGCGIPPDVLPVLFDRFSQGNASIARTHGGSGLGLAICRALVELMGGVMSVESRLGEGSTFSFTVLLLTGEGT